MNQDEMLERLSKDYLKVNFESSPSLATFMGIHDYDGEMAEGTPESVEDFIKKRKKFYTDVKALDPQKMSFDAAISREALLNVLATEMFEDEAHPRYRSKPEVSLEIADALHPLFVNEFAPFEERLKSITSRIEKVPRYLENTKKLLTDPVSIWVEMGMEECESVISFIDIIRQTAKDKNINSSLMRRLNDAGDKATESLRSYKEWLRTKLLPESRQSFTMKPEDYDKIIEMRCLSMNSDQLLQFGREMLEYSKELQRELASKISPGSTIEEVKKMLHAKHPSSFNEALKFTAKVVEDSRRFCYENDIVTMPPSESLIVEETPEFARNLIPFGAYLPPGKFDHMQIGRYWLSRPLVDNGQSLSMHNYGSILNCTIHEGYPGHHLQQACANLNNSTARLFTEGIEYIEGWAHYCEELMDSYGFSEDPAMKFEHVKDLIWRSVRVILDVQVSRGELNIKEAVDMLQNEVGYDRVSCITEIKWLTFNPGYQLSYLTGKKLIKDLLDEVKLKTKEKFSLKKFHDSMLYAGNLPMKQMAKVVKMKCGAQDQGSPERIEV